MIHTPSTHTALSGPYRQADYDSDVKKIRYSEIKCTCGVKGFFRPYGSYERGFDDRGSEECLKVKRVMCTKCGTTHAVLPDFIIPYRYRSRPFVIKIISMMLKGHIALCEIARLMGVAVEYVYALKKCLEEKKHLVLLMALDPELSSLESDAFMSEYFTAFGLVFMMGRITGKNVAGPAC